jgi:hypothetical protein
VHYVHRLVCAAFHGPPPSPDHEVAHSNGIKTDCRASNLRWATSAENKQDSIRLNALPRGSDCPWAVVDEGLVASIRIRHAELKGGRRLAPFGTNKKIAAEFNVTENTVKRLVERRSWLHV